MTTNNQGERIRSIDVVRGIVMVLMALDHVRVYSGIPAGGPDPGVFLTRWVTNFCAPCFAFFAGSSIYLHGLRLADRAALSRWLVLRGLWLVFLELTYLRLAWTFNLDFAHYLLAGVIWMLGWSMIVMALLVRLPLAVSAVVGVTILAGHNLAAIAIGDAWHTQPRGQYAWLWQVLYYGGPITVGGGEAPNFWVLYSIVPWTGVMAAGYAFGAVLTAEPRLRSRACYAIGGTAVVAFVIIQWINLYRQPPSDSTNAAPLWETFLTANKYPPSFLFVLMTLGPTIAALPLLEQARGRVAGWLTIFGRVPLFFYLLHIPLIHAVAVAISLVRSPAATAWLFGNHPMRPGMPPEGYPWSLGLLYLVTGLVVVMLYFPCRWFAALKARRKDALLSYL